MLDTAPTAPELEALYAIRFSARERERKDQIWQVLCQDYFQQFIDPAHDTVLDLACGLGEFSRHIRAGAHIAVDLNDEARALLPAGAHFHHTSAANLSAIATGSIDVCFSSNFLEHLPGKSAVDAVLKEVLRVLRPGGRYIALQPNIRFCSDLYWDFWDHHTALSDRSAREAFLQAGFRVDRLIPRFLPFSTKSALPTHPFLVRLYLNFPPAWKLLGKQFLMIASKPLERSTTVTSA